MIAFLGMGLLGSNFVRALRERGEQVNVWNRTPEKARELESVGAKAFDDPADAVRDATRIHLTLSDDAAVDAVLERARPGMSNGVVIVDHSTTTASGAAERVKRWTERGIAFQHAPVFMGPQNALKATGTMVASGDRALFDKLEPELSRMTGKLMYVGPLPERAAGLKLLGNLFFVAMVSGLADTFALAKALGITPDEVASLFEWLNPGVVIPIRVKRIIDADFEHPWWNLAMARKDTGLMLSEAERANVPLAVMPAIAEEMDRWLARGHAQDDWTVIAKDSLPTR